MCLDPAAGDDPKDEIHTLPSDPSVTGRPDESAPYWDFGDRTDRREDPIHRIHSYPAKFPAFITTKALQYAEEQGIDVKVVADVFCGCGTTAVEAKRNGKHFWGCDINPVATLIAKVKTRRYRTPRWYGTSTPSTMSFAAPRRRRKTVNESAIAYGTGSRSRTSRT